jgi:hypothetical protein
MKHILIFALLLAHVATAEDLKLFNPEIFGLSADSSVSLLLKEPAGSVEPSLIQVDIKDGKFYAATVRYKTSLSLADARQSLNRVYAKWQKPNFANDPDMGLWREESRRFSIQLTRDEHEIVVVYISWGTLRNGEGNKNSEADASKPAVPHKR